MKKKENLLRNPYIRLLIVFGSIALIVIAIGATAFFGYQVLFQKNPRFTLKHISVTSSGYWNGRTRKIMQILRLKKGETNIFAVKPKELRKVLKSEIQYSIENVEVFRILPDTLKFDIVERIPSALLYNKKTNLIVDRNGILLNKRYCVNINKNLPIITGFVLKSGDSRNRSNRRKRIPFGEKITSVIPALTLISLTDTDYPEFDVRLINLHRPNAMITYIACPQRRKIIKVILPFKHGSGTSSSAIQLEQQTNMLKGKLEELKVLYDYLKNKKKKFSEINLMFENQAVLK